MELQYFLSIDGLMTGIVAFIFGVVVLSKNKKNVINKTLFLLTEQPRFGHWVIGVGCPYIMMGNRLYFG
jgi:hypothetical protein